MTDFPTDEKHLSQIPAAAALMGLGFGFLDPEAALGERGGRESNVILERVLRERLKALNSIWYKGRSFLFSEENISSAVERIKSYQYDGLVRTNEQIYDLLSLGTSLEQTIEGDTKSFNLNYIDWKNPERNVFHVVPEFSVERKGRLDTARPDLVLFVNGIPFCVIECKAPTVEIDQGISQSIRNQREDYIPGLFVYVQMVLSVNKNAVKYATVGTPKKFWSIWKENYSSEDLEKIKKLALNYLPDEKKDLLFSGVFASSKRYFEKLSAEERLTTEQDKNLYSLCRPERLLELAQKFTVFDSGIKKIARYQQYFVVKSAMNRIKTYNDSSRNGGIIWHTQGSGKSLTMVMLSKALVLDPEIPNPRVVLVTDRKDLDTQLGNTFIDCGVETKKAETSNDLLKYVSEGTTAVITTLVHKFDRVLQKKDLIDDSKEIFVLVDESHRSHFGPMSAKMRKMFPNACYIGFTGTPLIRDEKKNSFIKFGGLIEPNYSIAQAVADGAVVPLLYEGRHVELTQDKNAIDLWFERHTQGLTDEQKADLKRKYSRARTLNQSEQVVYMTAFDVSEHYRSNWQGTGYKAQLVVEKKATAVLYKKYLDEIGYVTSEIIISGPDSREGYDDVDEEPTLEVTKFWERMMKRYGSEEEYNKQIINAFKGPGEPEIIIVVSKLLTGFDAPRNVALYLCKTLKEHTLLQAIARVNRIYEDEDSKEAKEFGYIIDYSNVLGELNRALTMYKEFEAFDQDDIEGALVSISIEVDKLPQKYSELCSIFKTIKNVHDEEEYETLLADQEIRDDFYEKLTEYSKTLAIAFSSEKFLMRTDDAKLKRYRDSLRKYQNLRKSVKLRYCETVDYSDYEAKIKKLLDTHLHADEVVRLNVPYNIFQNEEVSEIHDSGTCEYGSKSIASKADMIAYATKKTVTEKMQEDPAFYEKFSALIQKAIDDFKNGHIQDVEYLELVREYRDKVIKRKHEDIPERIMDNDHAAAFYGLISSFYKELDKECSLKEEQIADAALFIVKCFIENSVVNFWLNDEVKKEVINILDDYLIDDLSVNLNYDEIDTIVEKIMRVAQHRGINK